MGMSWYNDFYLGVRIDKKWLDEMRIPKIKHVFRDPPTKFDPHTGKKNERIRVEYTTYEWLSQFAKLGKILDDAVEGEDASLYNEGINFHGLLLIQTFISNDILIADKALRWSTREGLHKLPVDDIEKVKVKMRATLSPLNLWREEQFGFWCDRYFA